MADGDKSAACGYFMVQLDDGHEYPGTSDEVTEKQCLAAIDDFIEYDVEELGEPGSEAWSKLAEAAVDSYEVEPQGDEEMNVDSGGEEGYFAELHQLETDVVKYQDDKAWYLG